MMILMYSYNECSRNKTHVLLFFRWIKLSQRHKNLKQFFKFKFSEIPERRKHCTCNVHIVLQPWIMTRAVSSHPRPRRARRRKQASRLINSNCTHSQSAFSCRWRAPPSIHLRNCEPRPSFFLSVCFRRVRLVTSVRDNGAIRWRFDSLLGFRCTNTKRAEALTVLSISLLELRTQATRKRHLFGNRARPHCCVLLLLFPACVVQSRSREWEIWTRVHRDGFLLRARLTPMSCNSSLGV